MIDLSKNYNSNRLLILGLFLVLFQIKELQLPIHICVWWEHQTWNDFVFESCIVITAPTTNAYPLSTIKITSIVSSSSIIRVHHTSLFMSRDDNNHGDNTNNNINKLRQPSQRLSIQDCISWIDKYCHRSFLHAVISSNYHFLYRGISPSTSEYNKSTSISKPQPTIQYEPSDLLQITTYGTKESVQYFQQMEYEIIQKYNNNNNNNIRYNNDTNTTSMLVVRPSIGHLGTTSMQDANQWGEYAASIWPYTPLSSTMIESQSLSHALCYAWFRDYGLFYPRSFIRNIPNTITNDLVIDGDCYSEIFDEDNITIQETSIASTTSTLSDALQQSNCEILFLSTTPYLAIPSIYDDTIRDRLQQSYLI